MTAVQPFDAPVQRTIPPTSPDDALPAIPADAAEVVRVTIPSPDMPALSQQLQSLERELREVWTAMVELDAATAGRVGYAGRLVHQAAVVLGDHSVIA